MKIENFEEHIGGTEVCMKRLMMDLKICVQLAPNGTYFDDSYFSGVKKSKEAMAEGLYY